MSEGKYELNCICFYISNNINNNKSLKRKYSTKVIKLAKSSSKNRWEMSEVILQELVCCLLHKREEKLLTSRNQNTVLYKI